MSSGVFCSETAFDHPSYFDLSDSPLYSDEFDSTSKSLERQLAENNFNHLRNSPSNKSSPANSLSSDFMTSSYCQISTPSTPLGSVTPESLSTVTSHLEEPLCSKVSSTLEQNWAHLHSCASVAEQPSYPNVSQSLTQPKNDQTMLNPRLQMPFLSDCVQPLDHIDFGDLESKQNLSESENMQNFQEQNTSYAGQGFSGKTASFEPSTLDRYVLSPISETSEASLSSVNPFDNQILTSSQSPIAFAHSSEKISKNRMTQQNKNSMSSSAFSMPLNPSQSDQSYSSGNIEVSDCLDFNITMTHSERSKLPNPERYRHQSNSEDLQQPSISSPSFLGQPSLANTSELYLDSNPLYSHKLSACQYKKNVSLLSDDFRAKEEINAARIDLPYLPFDQKQRQFGQYQPNNPQTSGIGFAHNSSIVSSPCNFESQNRFVDSPQSNLSNLVSDCRQAAGDFPTFKQHHQPFSNEEKSNLFNDQFPEPCNLFETYPFNSSNLHNPELSTSSMITDQYSSFASSQPGSLPSCTQLQKVQMTTSKSLQRTSSKSFFLNTQRRHHPYTSQANRVSKSSLISKASGSRSSNESLCAVCGDNAACQHYGVRTCEGCKGFFKRTVQKKSSYVCLANKNCPVDKRRRNRCQFCRFEKCLAVGMVKEVVRKDDLKGRRGRLPSKAKSPKDFVAPPSTPVSFITSLVRAHVDTSPTSTNTDTSQFRAPGMPSCTPIRTVQEETHDLYQLLSSCFFTIRHWAEKIPGFCKLNQSDQRILIESSFLEIFAFRLAYKMEIQEGKFVFCNGLALHRDQLYSIFGSWTDDLTSFACKLADLNVDLSSFSCLAPLLLFQDRSGIRDKKKVESLQATVIDSLKKHVSTSPITIDRPNFFMKLLAFMPEVAVLATNGLRRLEQVKIDSPSVSLPQELQRIMELQMNRV